MKALTHFFSMGRVGLNPTTVSSVETEIQMTRKVTSDFGNFIRDQFLSVAGIASQLCSSIVWGHSPLYGAASRLLSPEVLRDRFTFIEGALHCDEVWSTAYCSVVLSRLALHSTKEWLMPVSDAVQSPCSSSTSHLNT